VRHGLQQSATTLGLLALGYWRSNDGADGLVEHGLETLLGQGRALKHLDGLDLLAHGDTLLVGDGCKALLGKTVDRLLVLSQIELGADQDDGGVGVVVLDLWVPLGLDVLERCWRDDRVADQEHIGLWVRERAEAIVILLSGSIPKTQVDWLSVNHDVGTVVC
jgi:hypothetical protein